MAYTDKTLAPGEYVLARGRFHWTYSFASWLWLLAAGWMLIGIFIFFARQIRKWTTELVVTNRRFIYKRGVLSIRTDEFTASRIQAITLSQPWLGRLLGYGHLNIRGEEIGQFGLPVIADPLGFRRALISSSEGIAPPENGKAAAA
ncbi:MAG: PH domain-containing protein [Parvibaculaceae bacterium]